MGIVGFDHWVITSGNVERTIEFYRSLGCKIVFEQIPGMENKRPTIRIGEFQKINIHPPETEGNPRIDTARNPSIGSADFCIEWKGTSDEIQKLLEENNITPIIGPTQKQCAQGIGLSTYIRDPDGNLVELTIYE